MYWDDYEDMYPEPTGLMGATAHDFDDHRRCDPRACPNAEQEDPAGPVCEICGDPLDEDQRIISLSLHGALLCEKSTSESALDASLARDVAADEEED